MKITIKNIEIVNNPILGTKSNVDLIIHSKIILYDKNTRDTIASQMYINDVDVTNMLTEYAELHVTESPNYTEAKAAFLEQVKLTYQAYISQIPTIDINNVTIEL